MPRLTKEDLAEANQLAKHVASTSVALGRARDALDRALKKDVDQTSAGWETLCNSQADAITQLDEATQKQRDWWRAKGF